MLKYFSNVQPIRQLVKLLAAATTVAIALPGAANAQSPFSCTDDVYLSQGTNARMGLHLLQFVPVSNPAPGQAPFTSVLGGGVPAQASQRGYYNGTGFRIQDGFIYGMNGADLVRVGTDGIENNLGSPQFSAALQAQGFGPLLSDESVNIVSGTVSAQGYYYGLNGARIYKIEINGNSGTVIEVLNARGFGGADLVIDLNESFFLSMNGNNQLRKLQYTTDLSLSGGQISETISMEGGDPLPSGSNTYGSQYLDEDNRFFISHNQTNNIYEIEFFIDPATGDQKARAIFLSDGGANPIQSNDGAFCPQEKFPVAAPPTNVEVTVFIDLNRNGSRDTGEPLFEGADTEIELGGTVLGSGTTGANGTAKLNNLVAGTGRRVRVKNKFGRVISELTNIDVLANQTSSFLLPIDPSGKIYDASSRALIAGATVTMTDAGGTPLPSACLLTGQQDQITGADGYYRFDLVPGADAACPAVETEYRIDVSASGYDGPPASTLPPTAGSFNPVGTSTNEIVPNADRPQGSDPTTHYLSFLLGPGDPDVINNHIALDTAVAGPPFPPGDGLASSTCSVSPATNPWQDIGLRWEHNGNGGTDPNPGIDRADIIASATPANPVGLSAQVNGFDLNLNADQIPMGYDPSVYIEYEFTTTAFADAAELTGAGFTLFEKSQAWHNQATGAYKFAILIDDDPAFGSPVVWFNELSFDGVDTTVASADTGVSDTGIYLQTFAHFDPTGSTVQLAPSTSYKMRVYPYAVSEFGDDNGQPFANVVLWDDFMPKIVSCQAGEQLEVVAFDDLNKNLVADPGEPRFTDLDVDLLAQDGSVVAQEVTDQTGTATFTNLSAGTDHSLVFTQNGAFVGEVENVEVGGGATGPILLPIDPSGKIYDAATRDLISGATVTLTDAAGTPVPAACVAAGQQNQVTGTDGFYRFDVIPGADGACPAGETEYRVEVSALGYEPSPSTVIPPLAGPYNPTGSMTNEIVPQSDRPQGGDPTDYYTSFLLESGDPDVVNNHIAIDFTPVTPGTVAVTVNWPANSNLNSYNILDSSGTVVATFTGPGGPFSGTQTYALNPDEVYTVELEADCTGFFCSPSGWGGTDPSIQIKVEGRTVVYDDAFTSGSSAEILFETMGPRDAIVCAKQGAELNMLDLGLNQNSYDKLTNEDYFGIGGGATIDTIGFASLRTVTTQSLLDHGCDIFVGGGIQSLQSSGDDLDAVEAAALATWHQASTNRFVVAGCDRPTAGEICKTTLGRTLTDIPNGTVTIDSNLPFNPLFCAGGTSAATFGGESSTIGLQASDVVLLTHDGDGTPAVTTDSLTDPSFLIMADADMIASSGSTDIGAGPTATTDQALYLLNTFKFAVDEVFGRSHECATDFNNPAASSTFACEAGFYQVFTNDSTFAQYDAATGQYPSPVTTDVPLDAAGYNIADNYVYAIDTNALELVRLERNGTTTSLQTGYLNSRAGAVTDDNRHVIIEYSGVSPHRLAITDLTTFAVTRVNLSQNAAGLGDLVTVGNFAYGIRKQAGDEDFFRIDLASGNVTVTPLTGFDIGGNFFGAAWVAENNRIFFSDNVSGNIYEILNYDTAPTPVLFATGVTTTTNDGFACRSAALIETYDYSDAPTTSTTYGGAQHTIVDSIQLGSSVTADAGDYDSAAADGDVDDGVSIPGLSQGLTSTISIDVTGAGGFLQGWIDWNQDGDFADAGEQIIADIQDNAAGDGDPAAGTIAVSVQTPVSANIGNTFARLRWSTTSGLDTTTAATDGEVEDYQVTVSANTGSGTSTCPELITGEFLGSFGTITAAQQNRDLQNPVPGYTYAPGGNSSEGQYVVTSDAWGSQSWNGLGQQVIGHTDGSTEDAFLLVNGSTSVGVFLEESIPVEPNKDFEVSAWFMNWTNAAFDDPANRPTLALRIFDSTGTVLLGEAIQTDIVGDAQWYEAFAVINSGSNSSIVVRAVNLSTQAAGNEFVMDDLSVKALTAPCFATDYSDAPISTTSYGGAQHIIDSDLYLGSGVTAEAGDYDSANADGDTDDGTSIPDLMAGELTTLSVISVGSGGYLQGWIDFDQSNTFDAGEQVAVDLEDTVGNTNIAVTFQVPPAPADYTTFARFRWSTTPGLNATDPANDGEVEDYQLTVLASTIEVNGAVFFDNAVGGGTPHDGLINGGETGVSAVTVQIINDATGDIVATTVSEADGTYTLNVPASQDGQASTIIVTAPDGTIHMSGNPNGVADADTTDGEVSFIPAAGATNTFNFGLVESPSFTIDQSAMVGSGESVTLAHAFTSGSEMTVTFELQNVTESAPGTFTYTLFEDKDCDGELETGEAALSTTYALAAGDMICPIVRVQSQPGAAEGHTLNYQIEARYTYVGRPESDPMTNTDTVTIGDQGVLALSKQVCNITTSACDPVTGAGYALSNTGRPGEILSYIIVFENMGDQPADAVAIFDLTPPYSSLTATAPTVVTQPSGAGCALTQPAVPVAGYTGDIAWTCSGSVSPGERGVVSFEIRVDQ